MHLLLPIGFSISPVLGWLAGAPWLTVLTAAVVLPLAELLLGRKAVEGPGYQWGAWIPRVVILLALAIPASFAMQADTLEWLELICLALSCGYVSGGIGIVLAHELGHRRSLIDRALSRALLAGIGYGHYVLEHNRGHHRNAATLPDPATAREHESLWQFMPRYFSGVFIDSLKLSRQQTGFVNETFALLTVTMLFAAFLFFIAGWKAIIFWIVQSWLAQTLVAAVDYVEHWGLQRSIDNGKPERMGQQHIWDCANSISDAILFNLPRHASHHLEPSLHCDSLYRMPASPQMPTGYAGMVVLAVFSPLFKKIMMPRLLAARGNHQFIVAEKG